MSSKNIALHAEGLCKHYAIYEKPQDRLKQFIMRRRKQYYRLFIALHPISFDIERGECVGFIGRNGSGKSTLLQLVAGTLNPTAGVLETSGRISALLELGAGFNPEFTGRENVFLNAAILGLSPEEISSRYESIARFAEIGDFMDQPVKTYSSGMYVRLAFAVAIHVDPEILLVDEALAVGDAPFQFKCMQKIEELRARGTSILFVTHDISAVKRLCNRAGWLHEGHLVSMGLAVEIANQYEDFTRQQSSLVGVDIPGIEKVGRASDENASVTEAAHQAIIRKTELLDSKNSPANVFVLGNEMLFKITYDVLAKPPKGLVVGAAIFRNDHLYVCGVNTLLDGTEIPDSPGTHSVQIRYPRLELTPGSYYLKTGLFDHTATVRWDFIDDAATFTVVGPYLSDGVAVLAHTWEIGTR